MKAVIKLTSQRHEEILIGVASIIDIIHFPKNGVTRIQSVGATLTTNWVLQSLEEIYEQINS